MSLSKDFGLCYRRIKRISPYGNTERNRVLRFLYAKEMLKLYNEGKHIINIDESWLAVSDYQHFAWFAKGREHSMRDQTLKCKINIIVAVSNRGHSWLAQTYVNTNEEVMQLFITHLAEALTQMMGNEWRDDTVFLLDGASYHRSKTIRKFT